MNTRHGFNAKLALCFSILLANTSHAEESTLDNWTWKLTPFVTYIGYGGSPLRSDMVSSGAYIDAQYGDRGGITGGASYTRLNYKGGISAINQAEEYLSGRLNFYPDGLPGRLSLRLDGHQINNDDSTNESDDVQVIAPQVSYLSQGKSLYLDLGYAISFYGSSHLGNGSLNVQQWTPTVGLGFNENYDWLQLRLYDVSASNTARAMRGHTDAVEIKLTHYFTPQAVWVPHWVSIGGLAGNRMYAVDSDTAAVYNLADEQKGGGFVAALWKLSDTYKATLSSGYDIYETRDSVTANRYTYSGANVFIGLTAQW
jgi:hypothetical protein